MHGLIIKNTGSWYTICADDGTLWEAKVKGNFRLRGIRSTNPVAIGDRVTFVESDGLRRNDETVAKSGNSSDEMGDFSENGGIKSAVPGGPAEEAQQTAGEGAVSAPENAPASAAESANSSDEMGDFSKIRTALITEIDDRKNYVIRKATNLSKQSHILAANVDQCLLIVTLRQPETSTTFIDRFLASAEAYRVPVVLIFNKIDLLSEEDDQIALHGITYLYQSIGYQCIAISAETGEGVDEVRRLLGGKITLLSGNSGVGKSTLINSLFPGFHLRTSEISDAYNTGKHTTTFSEMFPIEGGGYIIDTPGIKGFGTFDMERKEIGHYFREIFKTSQRCRFSNCTHTHEPGCAVVEAVRNHDISESRYQSYLSMLDDKDEDRYR